MLKKLRHLLPQSLAYIIVTMVVVAMVATNFSSGTTLSGWDNLHPEFNLSANLARSFSTVWQEYQGLGLLGGMGHGADVVRQLLLAMLGLILPQPLLRYWLVFLCLWIGGIGAVALSQYIARVRDSSVRHIVGTAAGLFYVLNLGTLQNFYVPFEPFYWFFAALPWLLYTLARYLNKPTLTAAAWFFLVSFLATPLGYLQTNFLVYGLIVMTYIAGHLLFSKNATAVTQKVKPILCALLIIFITNGFWFLPVLFFTLTQADVTVSARMNQIATIEVYLSNIAQGSVADVLFLKGYWWNLHDFDVTQQSFQYLLQPWRNHFDQLTVSVSFGVVIFMTMVGITQAVWKRNATQISLFFCFGLCLFMLIGENPPTAWLYRFLRDYIPLFGQIFRSSFTKWIVPTSLLYSVLFGLGVGAAAQLLLTRLKPKWLKYSFSAVTLTLVSGLLIFLALPSFQGHFLYAKMRLPLPERYQNLFAFFQTQPKQTRIATLPIQSFWGWNFYDWQYRGSGFLWYGIEQPIVDRAFDVWSPHNETLYNQLSTAVYGRDVSTLREVVNQYDISYFIVDNSVTLTTDDRSILRLDELPALLEQAGLTKVWSEDSLAVYKTANPATPSFITAPARYSVINTNTTRATYDSAFAEFGSYIAPFTATQPAVSFPFAQLAQTPVSEVSYQSDGVHVPGNMGGTNIPQQLFFSTPNQGESYSTLLTARRTAQGLQLEFGYAGEIRVGDQKVALPQLPKLELPITTPAATTSELELQLNAEVIRVATAAAKVTIPVTLQVGRDIFAKVTVLSGEESSATSFTFPANIWQNLTQPPSLQIPPATGAVEAVIATTEIPIGISGNSVVNCDILHRGGINVELNAGSLVYKADDHASLCTGLAVPELSTNLGWLLRWQGTNNQGRSIKWYLTNNGSERIDVEELLGTGNFDQTYAVPAWPKVPEDIYGISWETRSFGRPAANTLSRVNAYAFPLREVSEIQLRPTDSAATSIDLPNAVTILNLRKTGTYQYQFDAQVSSGSGLVALSQGFDTGWIGLAKPQHGGGIFEWKQLPHTQYNSWANAWLLPAGEWSVVIIFWPQLLSFAGYSALILTSGWLVWRVVRRSHSQRKSHSI